MQLHSALCINMKYRITKENIEFLASGDEQPALVKAIVEALVPKITDKLYFYSPDEGVRASISESNQIALVVMNDSNGETFHRYKRIHYYNGCTTLVPVLSGVIKKNQWVKICDQISSLYHAHA